MAGHPTVLHVAQPTDGGVARFVIDIATAQARAGWTVAVASPADEQFTTQFPAAGVAHYPWSATRNPGPRSLGELRSLRKIVSLVQPDLVHLHSSKAGFAGRIGRRDTTPVIFQPHAWSFEAVSGMQKRLSLAWERRGARRASALLCVSDAERARGAAMKVEGPFRVVMNGIHLERFPVVDDEDRLATKRKLGVGEGPLVVCVGRLCRQKGQDVLLAAWRILAPARPEAQLVLVGDGPERFALEGRADPFVRFEGHRANPYEWLSAADVVAVPSRWEGMPYSLLEAMATGRSVVATDVDGITEAAGGVAAIVPSEDPEAFADALLARLNDPDLAKKEGELARERIELADDARIQLVLVTDLARQLIARSSSYSSS